jgi:hypothetical protein
VPAALDPAAVLELLGNITGAPGSKSSNSSKGSERSTGSSSGQHPVRDGRERAKEQWALDEAHQVNTK